MSSKISNNLAKFEITALVLALIALGVYVFNDLAQKKELSYAAKIKADNNAFTMKTLEKFEADKKAKATKVATDVMTELNQVAQNPYDKDVKPYTFEKDCKACSVIEADDSLQMITVTTYNKKGDLIARTVIKPPSFVTYSSKEED